jgi:hypothetical protein
MSNIGKTQDDSDPLTKEEMRGALTKVERATVNGLQREMEILKEMRAEDMEQMNRLVGLYTTLRNEFTQFQQQRAIELNMRVNHGPTAPDASND